MGEGLKKTTQITLFSEASFWLSKVVLGLLEEESKSSINISGIISLRDSWERLKDSERLIIHWENETAPGGYLIEQILDIDEKFPIADRVIVLTTEPVIQDIRYLGELGVRRIVRMRNRAKEIGEASKEIINHLRADFSPVPEEVSWVKLQRYVDQLIDVPNPTLVKQIKAAAEKLSQAKHTARFFDLMAVVAQKLGRFEIAEKYFKEALLLNPNFFRSLLGLSHLYHSAGKFDQALEILQKLHLLNNNNISRLVAIAETHQKMDQDGKAEHYYEQALLRDQRSSAAINGLATIKFKQGEFDKVKELLQGTTKSFRFASDLNKKGIALVRQQKYFDALKLYTRAQYVLPSQEKGAQLFYNIGLCYYRWAKVTQAKAFLKLSLAKDPSYTKAIELMSKLKSAA